MTISDEKRLARYLLHKLELSGTDGRPTINMSQPTHVKFGLALIQLDLDERNKILTTSMWLRLVSRWLRLVSGVTATTGESV